MKLSNYLIKFIYRIGLRVYTFFELKWLDAQIVDILKSEKKIWTFNAVKILRWFNECICGNNISQRPLKSNR